MLAAWVPQRQIDVVLQRPASIRIGPESKGFTIPLSSVSCPSSIQCHNQIMLHSPNMSRRSL